MNLISLKPNFEGLFSDQRLDKRANKIVDLLIRSRSSSIKGTTNHEAEQKGFYRFLENDKVTEEQLIQSIQSRCAENVKNKDVIVIQDTSSVGLSNHRNRLKPLSGIGLVGNKKGLGFLMHPALVIDAKTEAMLGFSAIKLWHRQIDKSNNSTGIYKRQPIEEKESNKWIEVSEQTKKVLATAQSITIVEDREGDIYEQFCRVPDKKTNLVIRSRDNRKLSNGKYLHDFLHRLPVSGSYSLIIEKDIRKKIPGRTANIAVRYSKVVISKPSKVKSKKHPKTLCLFAVEAREVRGPKHNSIRWRLLTTHEVNSFESALRILKIYQQRWYIEQVFRLLKKRGFKIEESELSSGWSIRKLTVLLLNNILRIMQLLMAYENEEAQALTEVFNNEEIKCLSEVGLEMQFNYRTSLKTPLCKSI